MLHLLAATVKSAQAKVIAGNNPRISLTIIFWGGVDGEEESFIAELCLWQFIILFFSGSTIALNIHKYLHNDKSWWIYVVMSGLWYIIHSVEADLRSHITHSQDYMQ